MCSISERKKKITIVYDNQSNNRLKSGRGFSLLMDCICTFEKFQNMKDKYLEKCLEYNGKAERLISDGAAVIIKVSGFCATD